MEFIEINLFYFLFLTVYYWNINRVFDHLKSIHGNQDFVVNLYFKKIFLFNKNETTKKILDAKSNELTFIQENLNRYLGHNSTINCFNSSSTEWKNLHTVLKETLNSPNGRIKEFIERNMYILFEKHATLNDAVEMYICKILAEFNYGTDVNFGLYMQTRKQILDYLSRFHKSKFVRVPFIGAIWAVWMRWYYQNEMKTIMLNLEKLYENSDGALTNFHQKMGEHYTINLRRMVMETSFLVVLENDFISTVMMDYITSPTDDIQHSIFNGFLYPVRYRIIRENIENIPSGSIVIYHLLNSRLYFSWGPRACVGQVMVKNDFVPMFETVKKWITVDRSANWYTTERYNNIPNLKKIKNYRIEVPQDYLEKNIKCYYNDKTKTKLYDMISIYSNLFLFNYCVQKISNGIKSIEPPVKAIIAPEARAFPLAGAIAIQTQLPLHTIRKQGKFPGETHRVQFTKGYTTEPDVLEIEKIDLENSSVVLVDDGIASGGSAKACIDLISICHGQVVCVYVIAKHTYCECADLGVPVNHLFKIATY